MTAVTFAAEKIEIVPGYVSVAIHITGLQSKLEKEFSSSVSYREAGKGDCLPAYELIFNPHLRAARGVVVNLQENREYELKVTYSDNGKKSSFTRKFRTRTSDVPVAKTIVLNARNWKKSLTLANSGKPDGRRPLSVFSRQLLPPWWLMLHCLACISFLASVCPFLLC